MSNRYSKHELYISYVLTKFPRLKQYIKHIYQVFSFLISKRSSKIALDPKVQISNFDKDKETFGGYYDKTLIRNNNILTHSFLNKLDGVQITFNKKIIQKSNAWNWQQGSMLQWFSDEEIIFNDFKNGRYISVIHNIINGSDRKLEMPVYDISPDRSFALTLNFSRLAKFRPDYGYFNLPYKELPYESEDGVYKIDLKSNQAELVISIEDLKCFMPRPEMIGATHKVNHIMIAPNSKRFMFLHRWYTKKGVKFSRLITSDPNGQILHLLADNQMVSHCTWKNDKEIIGWMTMQEGNHYYCLEDLTNQYHIVGKGILTEDGHPSITKDERWLLTDTYPDKSRMSHLYLYDLVEKRKLELGSFFSPLKYRGVKRCDLHPRLSDDERSVSFDSTHESKRGMYIMDISKIIER